jgi:hypothetical protein
MKKNSFLLLSIAALLLTGASAAESETSSVTVALPTYVVEAERISPAERLVHRNLDALRDLARAPIAVPVELPALTRSMTRDARAITGTRVAKS